MTPPFHAFRLAYALASFLFLCAGIVLGEFGRSKNVVRSPFGATVSIVFIPVGVIGLVVSILPTHLLSTFMQMSDRLLQ